MSQAPRCPAGCEKQAHCPCCSLRTAAAAAAARTTDVARGGSKQRQQFGGGARAGAMALSHHLLLLLLLLFVALQARPLHAAPLRAWGADGGHALRRPPAARLDAGVEPLGQPADGNLKSTSAALPQPPAPQPRGHRRGPPTGKYSGEGAKTSSEALKNLQRMLEQLERGQGVAKVRSGSADSPVSAASSTAQSVPVPLPGKNPTGLPVVQDDLASLMDSRTKAPRDGTDVTLERTSPAPCPHLPLQPGWHPGDVAISGNADTPGQEPFKVDVQHLKHREALFLLTVVAATCLLTLALVWCCTAACYCLKKAMGKGSADPAHQMETGSFPSSLKNERSGPDTAKVSVSKQTSEQPLEAVAVEHPPSPLETSTVEHPPSPQETSTVEHPPSPQETSTVERPPSPPET